MQIKLRGGGELVFVVHDIPAAFTDCRLVYTYDTQHRVAVVLAWLRREHADSHCRVVFDYRFIKQRYSATLYFRTLEAGREYMMCRVGQALAEPRRLFNVKRAAFAAGHRNSHQTQDT